MEKRTNPTETRRLQFSLLKILKVIDSVCREHQLTYYLIAGTALGAVRHQGFIPWDDDADVGLPRPDYDRLVAHANEWLPEGYEIVSGATCPEYPYAFARIQDARTTYILRRKFNFVGGLPVDVFPLDGMTDRPLRRWWHYYRFKHAKKLLYYCLTDPYKRGHGLRCLFIKAMQACLSPEKLHRRLDRIQREFDYYSSPLVADHDNKPSHGILSKDMLEAPTHLKFEDVQLPTFADTDRYLSYTYGQYRVPPKEMPPQNFRLLDLDKPYRTYLAEQNEASATV